MTVIQVGAAPEKFQAEGIFFDGDTAVGDLAQVTVDETTGELVIARVGFTSLHWALEDLRLLPGQARQDLVILRTRPDPDARLVLNDDLLLARLPDVHLTVPMANRGRLALWALAAVASVALIVTVLVPLLADRLAEFIPPKGEHALGEATLGQIRTALGESGFDQPVPFCDASDGQEALAKMEARLREGLTAEVGLSVSVLDHDMVNAFALPGGFVVIFRGLIDAAETPEEVAAVLAHEIGHVASRDPTRHALRSAGSIGVLGLLFGDFAGGALVLFLTDRLIQADYSRDAEEAADAFARETMLASGIDGAALARFFERLRAKHGEPDGIVKHFAPHPSLTDRILASDTDLPKGAGLRPVLNQAEWAALRHICP